MELKEILSSVINGSNTEDTNKAFQSALSERSNQLIQSGKEAITASIFKAKSA